MENRGIKAITLTGCIILKSIGFRLTLIMLTVVLFGIGITVGVSVSISGKAITRETLAKIERSTESEAHKMNAWLSGHISNITTLADVLSRTNDFSESSLAPVLNAVTTDNDAYFEVYMGFPDGTAHTGSGYIFDYSWWHAPERGWYKLALTDTSKAHITSPYTDAQTGELCITAVHAVMRDGELLGVVSADIFVTDLQNMVRATTLDYEGYAILMGSNGDIIVHLDSTLEPDKDDNYMSISAIDNGAYSNLWKQISASDTIILFGTDYYTVNTLDATGWRLMTVLPANVVSKPIVTVILTVIPLTLVILALAALLIFLTIRRIITKPIAELVAAANDLSCGDVGIKVGSTYQGEMKTLAEAFGQIADSAGEQSSLIERLAGGDLTVDAHPRGNKDTVNLSLAMMADGLNSIMTEIHESINYVSASSRQVADGSQTVAQSSSEQTAVVEKLSNTIKGISDNTKTNAEIAARASALADTIKENAEKGSRQMNEMMLAVKEINDASQSINKVIKVIDDIAFQTNILALNAAVEAARAGQHGKGFAVVSEEVRSLASKSAAAAKDTGALITNSIEKAELGARIAEATASSLTKIVSGINESSRLVGEMAKLSGSQETEIESLNKGLDYVANSIQRNSASAEESAAASEEMSGQAISLGELVSQFNLRNDKFKPELPSRRDYK